MIIMVNYCIGFLRSKGNDFQNQGYNFIVNHKDQVNDSRGIWINHENIIQTTIYLAVRQCIEATWINDRDQFLYPNDRWKIDTEFQSDCLIYTLFHGQNRLSCEHGINHWIPFTEDQVACKKSFASHFMSDFLNGKIKVINNDLFSEDEKHKKLLCHKRHKRCMIQA